MTTQPDEHRPTIVLVHGAWADATGFDAEIRALQRERFRAIGFANPLRDLAGDSTYLAEFLRTLTGSIVLVGHSYGGNVISTAATGNDQVKALVYLNGWMCDEGESQQELLEPYLEQYLDAADDIWERLGTHMASDFLEGAFPQPLGSEEMVARLDRWLEESPANPAAKRYVREGRADLIRALATQARDAQA